MYYGMEQNSYNVILSPMFGPVGYGPRIQSENGGYDIYSIQGTVSIEDDIPVYGTDEIFKGMVYHEFSHSFVNPLTEEYRDELNKYRKLCLPNPLNTDNCLVIYTAQKAEDILGINSVFHGSEDYLITDGMEHIASGSYKKKGGSWSIE
jgi:hypothetical protein